MNRGSKLLLSRIAATLMTMEFSINGRSLLNLRYTDIVIAAAILTKTPSQVRYRMANWMAHEQRLFKSEHAPKLYCIEKDNVTMQSCLRSKTI